MVKIKNIFGDEYQGKQKNAVYQKRYGKQIRRIKEDKKRNDAPAQREQQARFRVGVAFYKSLTAEEKQALKEWLNERGITLTPQQYIIKTALDRGRATKETFITEVVTSTEGVTWHAEGWSYRQKIGITNNNATDLLDYQVKLILTGDKVGPSFRWDLQGRDIRFYDEAENKLSYWLEKWDEVNKQAVVWVKVKLIKANSSITIYMYYGNTAAQSESNGEAVFDFLDDFNDGIIDSRWDVSNLASAVEEGGYLQTEAKPDTWGNYNSAAIAQANVNGDFIAEAYLEYVGRSSDVCEIYLRLEGPSGYVMAGIYDSWPPYDPQFHVNINGIEKGSGSNSRPASGSVKIKIKRVGSTVEVYENDVLFHSGTFSGDFTTIKLTNTRYSTYNGKTAKWDWIRVYKAASVETSYSLGAEEYGLVKGYTTIQVEHILIEHAGIKDIHILDENEEEIIRFENLSNLAEGDIKTRWDWVNDTGKTVRYVIITSLSGTVNKVRL